VDLTCVNMELGVGVCSIPHSRKDVRGVHMFYSLFFVLFLARIRDGTSKQAMHVLSKPYYHFVRSAAKQVSGEQSFKRPLAWRIHKL
jgi:hypothetical protein